MAEYSKNKLRKALRYGKTEGVIEIKHEKNIINDKLDSLVTQIDNEPNEVQLKAQEKRYFNRYLIWLLKNKPIMYLKLFLIVMIIYESITNGTQLELLTLLMSLG
jgi:hypothetical protein